MLTKLIVLVVVVLIAGAVLRVYMPGFGKTVAKGPIERNGETLLADCPDMPNCQGSESSRPSQRVERMVITSDADTAMQRIVDTVSAQPGAALVTQQDRYAHFTFTSPTLRFVDDVELLISDDQASVQIRSASRLGKSDLGANAKRIDLLRDALAGQL